MAITGTWYNRTQNVPYADVLKQGTGWKSVHSIHGGPGRETTSGYENLDYNDLSDFQPENWGYCTEDQDYVTNPLYGYSVQDGTADRGSLSSTNEDTRADTKAGKGAQDDWPGMGAPRSAVNRNGGPPSGSWLRAVNRGADVTNTAKTQQPAALGPTDIWKRYLPKPNDADMPPPEQMVIQTSSAQRDKVLEGSQSQSRGTDAARAPIESRSAVVGMKIPEYGDPPYRHSEMAPREQTMRMRAFRSRIAGTADPNLLAPNEMYVSVSRQREPTAEPVLGSPVPVVNGADAYGYVDEDALPYV